MNPSFTYLNSSFPALPQTPTSGPTSSFAFPAAQDLPTAASVIKEAVDRAESTISLVYELLQSRGVPFFNEDFCSCPFDSRHRMPPESLFRHSLVCSSSPGVIDVSILDSLRYPRSLNLPPKTHIFKALDDTNTELCFSLDEFGDFDSNFFYKDCPGVVGSTDKDKTFTLPAVLAVECGNFMPVPEGGLEDLLILPSELWALEKETESWNDCPSAYSYTLLRIISCLEAVDDSTIKQWLIFNSPRRGIVLDVAMGDHIFTLLNVCLKAIKREACKSLKLISGNDEFSNKETVPFRCPILFEVLTWLASQLSVLYGETSGKLLVIDMFRQCLKSAASNSLFPFGQKMPKTDDAFGNEENSGSCKVVVNEASIRENHGKFVCGQENLMKCHIKQIFMSQVAGAIAALLERANLEMEIRELRFGRPLSTAQLLAEYSHSSARAIMERGKRADYRPLLEHDGLLWLRANNQDSSRNKSREELLAEERDYKRRRMSYRGKKAKRTPTQVTHDIIEEHMEEIKLAGGIGCFVKGVIGNGSGTPEPPSTIEGNVTSGQVQSTSHNFSVGSKRQSHTCEDDASTKAHYDDLTKYQFSRRGEQDESYLNERDARYRSRSPHSYRRHRDSHERYRHQKDSGNVDVMRNTREKEGYVSSHQSKYSKSNDDFDKSHRKSRSRDSRGRTYQENRSETSSHNSFDDRYDPSNTYSRYGDNISDEKYDKSDGRRSPTKDYRHRKERRSDYHSERHYRNQDES
ncbi:hypothetical protein H6P81_014050 [Aristolochia fimbriata]|uniref:CHHC U11-48K-type domain-containing protein n=1 Tax=Aristolochia fimbriata TaxID=158543 RepID=A0AAV7EGG2_ARIFI|nr:hypothetical protein H6P81_014050 [Aristolochia fimbriata]